MTITVDIGNADLSELLAQVEAGEEIILMRDGVSVAKLAAVPQPNNERQQVMEDILALRKTMPKVTQAEIAEWKAFGRR
jgi:antitoxin (DNA-binding transcriptional repressor) of toxin-antitoxin stability system